jgi:hypothetical protein
MAKAKKSKPRERLPRWRVSLIKGTPAKFIAFVEAPDAKTAEDIAAKEHSERVSGRNDRCQRKGLGARTSSPSAPR